MRSIARRGPFLGLVPALTLLSGERMVKNFLIDPNLLGVPRSLPPFVGWGTICVSETECASAGPSSSSPSLLLLLLLLLPRPLRGVVVPAGKSGASTAGRRALPGYLLALSIAAMSSAELERFIACMCSCSIDAVVVDDGDNAVAVVESRRRGIAYDDDGRCVQGLLLLLLLLKRPEVVRDRLCVVVVVVSVLLS